MLARPESPAPEEILLLVKRQRRLRREAREHNESAEHAAQAARKLGAAASEYATQAVELMERSVSLLGNVPEQTAERRRYFDGLVQISTAFEGFEPDSSYAWALKDALNWFSCIGKGAQVRLLDGEDGSRRDRPVAGLRVSAAKSGPRIAIQYYEGGLKLERAVALKDIVYADEEGEYHPLAPFEVTGVNLPALPIQRTGSARSARA